MQNGFLKILVIWVAHSSGMVWGRLVIIGVPRPAMRMLRVLDKKVLGAREDQRVCPLGHFSLPTDYNSFACQSIFSCYSPPPTSTRKGRENHRLMGGAEKVGGVGHARESIHGACWGRNQLANEGARYNRFRYCGGMEKTRGRGTVVRGVGGGFKIPRYGLLKLVGFFLKTTRKKRGGGWGGNGVSLETYEVA